MIETLLSYGEDAKSSQLTSALSVSYTHLTLPSYGEDAKSFQLTSALFYKDQAGTMDSIDVGDNAALRNNGLMKRRAIGRQSRDFDMMGRLHADIFFQDRYMLNEIGIKMKTDSQQKRFLCHGEW